MHTNLGTLLLVATSIAAFAGCNGEVSPPDEPMASAGEALTAVTYDAVDGDHRGYVGDGEWAPWSWKTECALNQSLKGISRIADTASYRPGYVHRLLCADATETAGGYPVEQTLDVTFADARRDTTTTDWDWGAIKAECARDESISAIAQHYATGTFTHARCVKLRGGSGAIRLTPCYVVNIGNREYRGSQTGGNWDDSAVKQQCADDEYIKGVSKYVSGPNAGKLSSMLCCKGQLAPQ